MKQSSAHQSIAEELLMSLQQEHDRWRQSAAPLQALLVNALEHGQDPSQRWQHAFQQLLDSKHQLARTIHDRTQHLQLPDWTPPDPDTDFADFHQRLQDLAALCTELDRLQHEKLAVYLQQLESLRQLSCSTPAAATALLRLQQQAETACESLRTVPLALADRDTERLLQNVADVLLLAQDAELRLAGLLQQCPAPADIALAFENTARLNGSLLAVELLRAQCRNRADSSTAPTQTNPAPPPDSNPPEPLPAVSAELLHTTRQPSPLTSPVDAPSREQIRLLLQRFPAKPAKPAKTTPSHHTPTTPRTTTRISRKEWNTLADSLRNRTRSHGHRTHNNSQSSLPPSAAAAIRCLVMAIECQILAHPEPLQGFAVPQREQDHCRQLLKEACGQAGREICRLSGTPIQPLPELVRLNEWLQHGNTSADKHNERQPRATHSSESSGLPLMQQLKKQYGQMNLRRRRYEALQSVEHICRQLNTTDNHPKSAALWATLDDQVSRLVRLGCATGDTELRQRLSAVCELLPQPCTDLPQPTTLIPCSPDHTEPDSTDSNHSATDATPHNPLTVPHPSPTLREALLYAEEWLKQQRSTEDAAAAEPASATVATVKSLLRGRTLVVLGTARRRRCRAGHRPDGSQAFQSPRLLCRTRNPLRTDTVRQRLQRQHDR
jgi:hypothetical protein